MAAQALANKVVLITGGSKGIGAAAARVVVAAGARVAINYSSDSAEADKLVSELGKDVSFAIKADAGSVKGAEEIVKATVDKFGGIDVLLPNAGILPMKTVEAATEEDFDKTFALNVKGPWFLAQKAIPHMKPGSRIIFVSTSVIHASGVLPTYALYGATKGAIEAMTPIIARDLGTKGINVNCIAPGPTATELFLRGKPDELIAMIAKSSPYNRLGQPEDIAEAILFLAGENSRWMSGQVMLVNGASSFK